MDHNTKRNLERQLRYVGLSQTQAKAAVAVTARVLAEAKSEEARRGKTGEKHPEPVRA